MSEETRQIITWTLGTTVAICALIGVAVRLVLLPYIRANLTTPLAATLDQVQNSHTTNMRHDLDATHGKVEQLGGKVEQLDGKADAHAITLTRIETTLTLLLTDSAAHRARQSQTERDQWAAINALRRPPIAP